ncbi:MAG: hypothetical protein R3C03_05190 [Pirellulaceae bacterium]
MSSGTRSLVHYLFTVRKMLKSHVALDCKPNHSGPSVDPIDTDGKTRHVVSMPNNRGAFELWSQAHRNEQPPAWIVLKFPGMAGRAERATISPLDDLDLPGIVFAVNSPGYGTSPGVADVQLLPHVAEAAFDFVFDQYPTTPIIVSGNSLGTALALWVTANRKPNGVILRNPPPIHELIRERRKYNWWNLGMGRIMAHLLSIGAQFHWQCRTIPDSCCIHSIGA